MAVEPEGSFSLLIKNGQLLLARSGTWQDVIGADNETEALDLTFMIEAPKSTARPFGVVGLGNEVPEQQRTGTGPTWSMESGIMTWIIRIEVLEENQNNATDAYFQVANVIGPIKDDMIALANTEDNLRAQNFKIISFARSDAAERQSDGDFYQAIIQGEYR